jgi:hypothetical protein
MSAKWLGRDLIVGPYLTLALSEKDFQQVLRHCKVPRDDWSPWVSTPQADATMHRLTNADGGMVCVVCLRNASSKEGVQIASLLVHEAVHIWQAWRDFVGEHSPSAEFEAYGIQAISQRLMTAYRDAVKPAARTV